MKAKTAEMSKVISLGERSLSVEPQMIPLQSIIPNPNQPRMTNLLDSNLQTSIMETRGLVQPVIVERLNPEDLSTGGMLAQRKLLKERYKTDSTILKFLETASPKYMLLDGERRWANIIRILKEKPDFQKYLSSLPCDVVAGRLNEKDRYIIWVSIHKLRKEWRALEKETAAKRLIELTDPATAASMLGTSVRQLDKFIQIYNLAQRMREIVGERSVSYARESLNLAQRLRPQEVINAIVDKVNAKLIKDSVDIRKLRLILDDQSAKAEFMEPEGNIESAMQRISSVGGKPNRSRDMEAMSLKQQLDSFRQKISSYPLDELLALHGDEGSLENIRQTIALLEKIAGAID